MRAVTGSLAGAGSDGGVHSHYSHMIALANAAREADVAEIFVMLHRWCETRHPLAGLVF